MRINTNVSAINTQRILSSTETSLSRSMQRLSSGYRINRAADDAAGLGIANKLRADTKAMTQANRNAEQANSLLQIAEGSVSSIENVLERMKELATQAGSDSVDDNGRAQIEQEFTALRSEVDRTVNTTTFQGKKLLDNSFGNSLDSSSTVIASGSAFNDVSITSAAAGSYTLTNPSAGKLVLTDGTKTQTATLTSSGKQTVNFSDFGISLVSTGSYDNTATTAAAAGNITIAQGTGGSFLVSASGNNTNDIISLGSIDLRTNSLSLGSTSLTSTGSAQSALGVIDSAMSQVSSYLGQIGAAQNRIEYAMSNLATTIQNYSSAESVIRDVDMAAEMTTFSKNQILQQAGTSMLAQANQSSQGILTLLRG